MVFSRKKREASRPDPRYCSRQCNGKALRNNQDWRDKLSKARKGVTPWNKGVRMWETRPHPRGTLGMKLPPRITSETTRHKMSESHRGKKLPKDRCGSNHHWWKGGKTTETVRDRACPEYHQWRIAVFIRDRRRCVECGSGTRIHAHHVIPFSEDKTKRFDVANGITLCWDCHGKRHGIIFTDHALNHCETCQKKIKVGARFCLKCRSEHTADKYKCFDCGKRIGHDKTSKRCRSCAAKIRRSGFIKPTPTPALHPNEVTP